MLRQKGEKRVLALASSALMIEASNSTDSKIQEEFELQRVPYMNYST